MASLGFVLSDNMGSLQREPTVLQREVAAATLLVRQRCPDAELILSVLGIEAL